MRASEEINMTVATSGSANECTIVEAVRVHDTGAGILGDNFFSIELFVEQVVYVTANNALTLEDVTALVQNGFDRGRGGRTMFLTLLTEGGENLAFSTVLDVEVLNEVDTHMLTPTPSLTNITLTPTNQPTLSPTLMLSPTGRPSATSSQVASGSPTGDPFTPLSALPSSQPSVVPSAPRSMFHLAEVTTEPSTAPNMGVAARAYSETTPPSVVAAISIGGCFVVVACCMSVFLCRKNWQQATDQQNLLSHGDRRSSEDNSRLPLRNDTTQSPSRQPPSKSQGLSALPIVPDMVRLDDEHRSLAETTLGEHTAGRKPPKKKRLVEMGIIMNSFEDESLYTSPIGIFPRIQPGRRIDEDDDDKEQGKKIRSLATLPVGNNVSDGDVFFPLSASVSSSRVGSSSMLPSSPTSLQIEHLVAAELGHVASGDPESLPSEFGSNYMESSDEFGGISGASRKTFSRPSTTSSLSTKKADNVAAVLALAKSKDEEDPWTVDAPGTYAESGSSSLLLRKKPIDKKSHISRDSVKSPMQFLETHAEESPNGSENAHSMIQLLEEEDRKTSSSPISLDANESIAEPSKSTQTWQTVKSSPSPTDNAEGQTAHRHVLPYRTRYLLGLQSPTAQRELEAALPFDNKRTHSPLEPTVHIFHPSKPAKVVPSPGRNMRQHTLESPPPVSLATGDISVLTSESSDASENGATPWLFHNVAQTMTPHSTSADIESLSGKSHKSAKSNNSAKSWRSQSSSKSHGSHRGRKKRKGSSAGSRGSHGSTFSFGSPVDIPLAPRSLENDLLRLETQLAALKSTDSSKQPRVPPSPPGISGVSSNVESMSRSSNKKVNSKQRIIVVAPPGKLGVVLANRHDGMGTVVSELRGSSPLRGALVPGDKLRKCLTVSRALMRDEVILIHCLFILLTQSPLMK